jgi:thimet oligopeptidase
MQETPLTDPTIVHAKTPDGLGAEAVRRLDLARSFLAGVLAVHEVRTVANTLEPFNEMYTHIAEVASQAELALNTHPEAAVREAADKAYQDAKKLETEFSLNRALYDAVAALEVAKDDTETQRAVFKTLRDFRRAGVDRDEATRVRVRALWDEINAIGVEFDNIIRGDVRSIQVTREELDGLPEDFLAARPPGPDGKITLTTNYPDALPVLQYGRNGDVRRRILFEFRNRGYPKNVDVLKRLIAKRHDLATLLGYRHWGDYITEDKMIGSANAAAEFIEKVTQTAERRAREDYRMFLARKRVDQPEANALDPWDRGFYEEIVRAEQFSFDSKELRPYFPFARVREGLFTITSRLFGVRYERVQDAALWHPQVEAYDVFQGDARLGRFYLDLHPREGKFTHAAAFTVALGLRGKQLPQACLVCNFPDPTKGPALMTHDDVVTFFHEFGHLLHGIFAGGQRWAKNGMGEIEWDFVEAPSQMLEEWTRDADSLRTFARHHETLATIPDDLVRRLVRADAVGRGLDSRRQMSLAALSLNCYIRNPAGLDPTALAQEITERYDLIPWFEGTHFECGFGHLNGYSAIYYTYMWSLVIAKDLFQQFKERGDLLDPMQAGKYRRLILQPGSSRPAADMVREYLGREPSFEAFAAWLDARL